MDNALQSQFRTIKKLEDEFTKGAKWLSKKINVEREKHLSGLEHRGIVEQAEKMFCGEITIEGVDILKRKFRTFVEQPLDRAWSQLSDAEKDFYFEWKESPKESAA